ncbi:MAG TPA: hypothetical protein VNB94_03905 [Mycobacteriales bacterium]|nr:hypothetical protein [Mycobacteriales bacterium]
MAEVIARGTDETRRQLPWSLRRSRVIDGLASAVAVLLLAGGTAVRSAPAGTAAGLAPATGAVRVYGSRPAYDDVAAGDNLRDSVRGDAGRVVSMPSQLGVQAALRDVAQQLCAGALDLTVREQSVSADFRRADFAVTATTYYNSIKERVSGGGFVVRLAYQGGQYVFAAERRTGECSAL